MNRLTPISAECVVLSDLVPVRASRSWLPRGAVGYEPFNKYLFRNERHALLVDSGAAAHRPSVMQALEELLGERSLTVVVTRSELECIGNLGAIADRYPRTRFLSVTKNLPLLGLAHYDRTNKEIRPATSIRPGDTFADYGFPHLHVVEPLIKTLSTIWIVDAKNDILLCTDSFSCQMAPSPEAELLLRDVDALHDVNHIRAHILAKFDWVARADMSLLKEGWDNFFSSAVPGMIAPGLGRLLSGETITKEIVRRYQAALFGAV